MSRTLASDVSLADVALTLGREARRHKRAIRDHRRQLRLIRAHLASVRAECKKQGVELHDAY